MNNRQPTVFEVRLLVTKTVTLNHRDIQGGFYIIETKFIKKRKKKASKCICNTCSIILYIQNIQSHV